MRTIRSGSSASARQKPVSLTQYASRSRRSARPNASNISTVRQATPSACPTSSGPSLRSTITVVSSGKLRELRGEDEAGGATADDEHVGLLREARGPFGDGRVGMLDERIAGLVAVEMELHGPAFLPTRGRGVASRT